MELKKQQEGNSPEVVVYADRANERLLRTASGSRTLAELTKYHRRQING